MRRHDLNLVGRDELLHQPDQLRQQVFFVALPVGPHLIVQVARRLEDDLLLAIGAAQFFQIDAGDVRHVGLAFDYRARVRPASRCDRRRVSTA